MLTAASRYTKAFCFVHVYSLVSSLRLPWQQNRRQLLERSSTLIVATWLDGANDAHAARGAAELDFEYYIRDMIGGNAKEGNVQSSPFPEAGTPRTLKDPLLSLMLDDDCTSACIPAKALLELAPTANLSDKVKQYRSRVSRSFATRAPWQNEHVTDQFYFDLTAYAMWRSAADFLPNYVERDRFARNVGRGIYQTATNIGLLETLVNKKEMQTLSSTIPSMTEILNLFVNSGYCRDYRIGDNTKAVIFDALDDETLADGASVDCLISVFEPATLGASLQITGEQSRFAPEFVGTTLAAMWEAVGVKSRFETYFVDNEYRPNPKDYFPNEQLLQFTLQR